MITLYKPKIVIKNFLLFYYKKKFIMKIFLCFGSFVKNIIINAHQCRVFFKDSSFEAHFLRKQSFKFFNLWLLISVAATLCFLLKFSPQVKLLQY